VGVHRVFCQENPTAAVVSFNKERCKDLHETCVQVALPAERDIRHNSLWHFRSPTSSKVVERELLLTDYVVALSQK